MDAFLVLKFLSYAALPPASMGVGLVCGIVLAAVGLRRLGLLVGTFACIATLVLSLPPVSDALVIPLQIKARVAAAEAPACCYEAIVVLGGGVTPAAPLTNEAGPQRGRRPYVGGCTTL
jgi:hypothetical protein